MNWRYELATDCVRQRPVTTIGKNNNDDDSDDDDDDDGDDGDDGGGDGFISEYTKDNQLPRPFI